MPCHALLRNATLYPALVLTYQSLTTNVYVCARARAMLGCTRKRGRVDRRGCEMKLAPHPSVPCSDHACLWLPKFLTRPFLNPRPVSPLIALASRFRGVRSLTAGQPRRPSPPEWRMRPWKKGPTAKAPGAGLGPLGALPAEGAGPGCRPGHPPPHERPLGHCGELGRGPECEGSHPP